MASKNTLKQWFSTGKKPTQGQFAELIESFFHKAEDTVTISMVQNLSQVLADKVSAADLNLIRTAVGNIGELQTNTKANLVAALNELVSHDEELTLLLNDVLTRLDGISEDLNGGRFIESTEKGAPGGVATLDAGGKVPAAQLPVSPVTSVNSKTGAVVLNKSDIGLAQVDNTSDANKPISAAQQTAFNQVTTRVGNIETDLNGGKFILSTTKGAVNGIATLDAGGKVPLTQLPVLSQVISVNSKIGAVVLSKADLGLAQVDNTSDANKPISSAQQTALFAKANNTDVVHVYNNETIEGTKTFSNPAILNKGIIIPVPMFNPAPPSANNFSVYAVDSGTVPAYQGIAIHNGNETKRIVLSYKGLTDNRFYYFPDKTGTIALTTDVPISEEGSWVPTWHEYSSPDYRFWRIDSAVYARVGKIVTINLECIIERFALTNSNHSISIGGLPFRCRVYGAVNYTASGANNYAPRFGVTLDTHLRFHEQAFEGTTTPIGATFWIRSTLTYIMI